MNWKLKCLGFLLGSALALGAAAAPAGATFTAASYPATFSGVDTGTHVFSAAGGTVNCVHATFSGQASWETSTQTVTPVYEECTAFGFVGAEVTMNGCDYLVHDEGILGGGFYFVGTVDLVCPKEKEVTIDAGPCSLHIPGQTGLSTMRFTNGTSGGYADITSHAFVNGITGTLTKNNFLCFFTAGQVSNGSYSGTTTVTGKNNEGSPQGIDIDH